MRPELDGRTVTQTRHPGNEFTRVQLWPHRHGTDAMFMAALRKP